MKRLAFILLATLLSFASFAQGIATSQDLSDYFSALGNGASTAKWASRDGVVRLTSDIDLSKVKKLRTADVVFEGHFDGQGHKLIGWKTTEPLFKAIGANGIVRGIVIDATCSMKFTSKSEELAVGFIAGINAGRVEDCESFASIDHSCKFTKESIFIGGLVGINNNIVVRCKNHGSVSSTASADQTLKTLLMCVGGVIGGENKDASRTAMVAYCENTGAVSSVSDFISQNIGGVVGGAGRQSIKHCVNRGPVSGKCLLNEFAKLVPQTKAGGIVGMSKSGILSCCNYGTVTTVGAFEGFAAGIVASPFNRMLVTDCENFGKVESKNEKVHYNGGIAGNVGRPVHFKRCANHSAGGCGLVGHIYRTKGAAETATFRDCVDAGGTRDGYAENVDPRKNGDNVFGTVKDESGAPVGGVVVSDGHKCVVSSSDGSFSFKSDLPVLKFVSISVPAGYALQHKAGCPTFFKRVPLNSRAAKADFVLSRDAGSSSHTVAIVGSPKVSPTGRDYSMEAWKNNVVTDLASVRKNTRNPFFCIVLGDIVNADPCAYDEYLEALAAVDAPMFSAIGAGDYDQNTMLEDALGRIAFETYFSPVNYSFNAGNNHYVVLNSVQFGRQSAAERYRTGLDAGTVEWLENDLKYVTADKTVILCSSFPLFEEKSEVPGWASIVMGKYSRVYAWSSFGGANKTFTKAGGKLICSSLSRCSGSEGLNRKISVDGTPQGYVLLSSSGKNISWSFKSIGQPAREQIRAYSPFRTGDGYVKACIWAYTDGWQTPEWWENGKKAGTMEFNQECDLEYQKNYAEISDAKLKARFKPSVHAKIFRIQPSSGCHGGEIRVKDRFGVEYRQEINW